MTLRTTGGLSLPELTKNEMRNGGAVSTTYTSYGSRTIGVIKSIDSVYTGKFVPRKIRLNPVVIKTGSGKCTPGMERTVHKTASTYWRSTSGPWISHLGWAWPVWDANLASYSRNKCDAKLNQAELDIGMMLAEMQETIKFLVNPIMNLSKFLKEYKGCRASIDSFGNTWLAFKYGAEPLVKDINDIIDYINRKLVDNPYTFRKKKGQYVDKKTETVLLGIGSPLMRCNTQSIRTYSRKSVSNVYYQLVLECAERMRAKRFGWDLEQALALGWELIPYSFVVDWFVDVGNWLRAISPSSHADVLGRCTSQHVVMTVQNEHVGDFSPTDPNYIKQAFTPPVYNWYVTWLERRVDPSGVGVPSLVPRALGFEKSLSGLCLLWQQLSNLLIKQGFKNA